MGVVVALATAGSAAAALQALPPGAQVNDDVAAGIDRTLNVNAEEPTNADVVGGALTAGGKAVPWAVFRQTEGAGNKDQVFSRSFANGAWTTRGIGTVGGRSSANPQFRGSLNFDQGQDGEAPAIDFAGTGRTVPWATWYENTPGAGFDKNNIFASRFDNTGDANQGKWIFGGQARGLGGGTVEIPSLNIHTGEEAENPSVAGGSAADPTKPGPWVTWQETDNVNHVDQIFVSRPEGPGMANCDGVTPAGELVNGHVPSIGGFCWQQTGIPRVGTGTTDPSLNVDPTRTGIEPDIAFTGNADAVPWVVWYEKDGGTLGLHSNDMVFAAKGVSDANATNGGFEWTAVGNGLQGTLDTSGATHHFGNCAESSANESLCSLNADPEHANAEDPRVAAGTMNPANPTVPWVVWDEDIGGGAKQIFVSRLVGTGAAAHFQIVNGGAPISTGATDSTRPDITFSGNTPYVTWRENVDGVTRGFVGHFVNAANPQFHLDRSDVPLTPNSQADVREPISSSCIATPFNNDGQACQGASIGTPFFLFTNGATPRGLFASAYAPDSPVTGAASLATISSATLNATDNPEGASVNASFQFGTTTAYGGTTTAQKLAPGNADTPFSAAVTGLPAGTTIHYRAVVTSDFGTFVGPDQTFQTASATPPPPPPAGAGHASVGHAKVSGNTATVPVTCSGSSAETCKLALTLTVTETLRGHKVIAVTARKQPKTHKHVAVVGRTLVTLTAGHSRSVRLTLNSAGRKLLAKHHTLRVTLHVTETLANGHSATVATRTLVFRAPHRHHKH
ncbi:MAG TPA: hypothetical protein VGF93_05585 [Solirubrobacteraceae bacterium]